MDIYLSMKHEDNDHINEFLRFYESELIRKGFTTEYINIKLDEVKNKLKGGDNNYVEKGNLE